MNMAIVRTLNKIISKVPIETIEWNILNIQLAQIKAQKEKQNSGASHYWHSKMLDLNASISIITVNINNLKF